MNEVFVLKKLKKEQNVFIIMLILIFAAVGYPYLSRLDFDKSYSGLSIKEVENNYKKYINQTVTFEAWYDHGESFHDGAKIKQYDIFGEYEGSINVHIDYDKIDTSMLMWGNEYFFTGTFHREPRKSEFTYENETYTSCWNATYLDITKIKPFYDDINHHNTSKFIGTWKVIENDYGPYTGNWTWVFYENNTLEYLDREDSLDDHYVVDGDRFYHEYYFPSTVGHIISDCYYAEYFFTENDTKLRLEHEDGRIVRIFQKIE